MSFYSDASLVLIPSGYKDQKIYSAKPTDGSGDLVFSRASNATRVASNGLIEKVRTNLALQSQTLSVSPTWTAYSGTTITADAVAAPDGTMTADQISGTSAAFRGIRQTIISSAIPHTFSVYLRSATGSTTTARIWVDGTNITATVTTSWQRFSVTATTASSFDIQISTAVSSAIDVYAWGAQLETGDIATDYIATTTTAVSVGPVSGLPRLDYLNSSCPRLLLEPQRTNVLTYSEQFDNAAWTKTNTTITANTAISPDGTQNADTISKLTAGVDGTCLQLISATSTGYVGTIFIKQDNDETRFPEVFLRSSDLLGQNEIYAQLNTKTGATAIRAQVGTVSVSTPILINGYWRISLYALANSNTCRFGVRPAAATTIGTINLNAIGSIIAYGAQVETNATYPTSYIPTLGTSVTRVADAALKTGISSLIGQTNGAFFVDITFGNSRNSWLFSLVSSNWQNDSFYLETFGANNYISINTVKTGAAAGGASSTFAAVNGVRAKIAVQYTSTTLNLFINGVKYAGTRTAIPACTALYINELGTFGASANQYNANRFNQVLTFTSTLTDAQCIELTTL